MSHLYQVEKQQASLLFPEGLLDFFTVQSVDKNREHYIFRLDEKNITPEGYANIDIESKGFYNEESITDFPLRGNRCTLKLRRRKWLHRPDGKIIRRDWNIVAKGTRTTSEFASFLKELHR